MSMFVDTSVWSLALRRSKTDTSPHPAVVLLRQLIEEEADVRIPGIVLQEVLSGVRHQEQFDRLRTTLHAFRLEPATEDIHVRAAEVFNACQRGGVMATAIDCLIAATTQCSQARLLATDGDYQHIASVVPLELIDWSSRSS